METLTSNSVGQIAETWQAFRASLGFGRVIRSEEEYARAISLLDALVDEGALKEDHVDHDLLMFAADIVEEYDQRTFPLPDVSGIEVLRFLMKQHSLKQSDLAEEIGSQGVVSEILRGRRELNKSHILALSKRFSVSPAVFF